MSAVTDYIDAHFEETLDELEKWSAQPSISCMTRSGLRSRSRVIGCALYRDVYFMVRDGGIVTSLDAATGRLLKEGRTREAMGEYYSSPVAADGKVFLASSEGKITVLKAAAEWEVLRVNDLADEVHATPALSEGRIYVRTHGALYCFATIR